MSLDDSRRSTFDQLTQLGIALAKRMDNEEYFSLDKLEKIAHLPEAEPDIDPEGIARAWLRFNQSLRETVKEKVKEKVNIP